MWEKSMKGLSSLIRRTTPSSFAYICEKNGGSLLDKGCLLWDHLVLILMIHRSFCHLQKSLLGHVITSTNQLQQNWQERTISFILCST